MLELGVLTLADASNGVEVEAVAEIGTCECGGGKAKLEGAKF